MKSKYTEFDKALIEAIKAGHNTAGQLDTHKSGIRELAQPFTLASKRSSWGCPPYRVIDRRLQVLRKDNKISFNGRIWVVL